ncbi:DUF1906 domain-containing protein [Spirillospora sp. NPDC048819]|uniref:DUF1906 domain-containing protein n=1 Tax=Spirillospora sp. NPDC048819 TaxID=3155268 RepID=UPI0033ED2061
MRHVALFGTVLCGVAATPVLAVLGTAAARPAPGPAPALTRHAAPAGNAAGPRGPRVVEYRGLRIPVPAGWEVHRLDQDPARCVRYDRRAIYLGRPGPQPDCPARIVGRTEAVHVQPAGVDPASRTAVRGDELATLRITPTVDHEMSLALPRAGVTITGVYGTDPARLQRVLRGAQVTKKWSAGPHPPEPSRTDFRRETPVPPEATAPTAQDKKWVRGKGFDTCTAPSLATMNAWRPSFEVTNIYIGGAARGCAQPNLTRAWVREVREMGYRITPTYVGLQAPCGSRPQRFTAKNAAKQGRKAAVDAARKAKALGIPEGAPIYLDMEAYDIGKPRCRDAVLRFVDNWVRKLKKVGYTPCLYSSVKSGIRDVGRATGISKPVAIWFAHWNGKAEVYGDRYIPDHWWHPHRRIKQYRGDHREQHGGVTLTIDSNIVDGRVY